MRRDTFTGGLYGRSFYTEILICRGCLIHIQNDENKITPKLLDKLSVRTNTLRPTLLDKTELLN